MGSPRYQVYGLRETYAELGSYQFKVVLNPRGSRSAHGLRVEVRDSDGSAVPNETEVWGRKLRVGFTIGTGTADGVARASIYDQRGDLFCQLSWWVIKP